jgi:hypothetical protein
MEIAQSAGFVAFGTKKWELLRRIDDLRAGASVPVLMYPSHEEDAPAKDSFLVCWFGWYVGHVQSRGGAHPLGMKHRPPTTSHYESDNKGYWAAFWHGEGLRELPKERQLPIGKIGTIKGGWRKDAPPRGPELVALPDILSNED